MTDENGRLAARKDLERDQRAERGRLQRPRRDRVRARLVGDFSLEDLEEEGASEASPPAEAGVATATGERNVEALRIKR
jgi:hypothetical protein